MISCPSCETEQAETSQFCSACGAALSPEHDATRTHEFAPRALDGRPDSASLCAPHGQFLPGARVANRYRIVSLVGKGGMGEVYRADDLKLGQTVALKFLPKDVAENRGRLEHFHGEVRLARQINHPNVCSVYDIGEVDGQHFLSMEYIDGEDLSVLLRRIGRIPDDKGVEIAQQLCAGLAAAHEKGVLHRDLKPANIMLDGRGHVRITDFGLAQLADEAAEGEVAGTPAYMAPEQFTSGRATIQSDLYALGLILYELLTGESPRRSGSLQNLLREVAESTLSQSLRFPETVDPAVKRVILRCLEKEPAERPRSARAVAAELPGGDPLAAALAAGETPSPEMVANAGSSGQMSLPHGIAWLSAMLIGLAAAAVLASQVGLLANARLRTPPEGLAALAEEMLRDLGYGRETYPARAQAHGFEPVLPTDRVSGSSMAFWYRQSGEALIPHVRLAWIVTMEDPQPTAPGMLGVRLSPDDARLLELQAVPHIDDTTPASVAGRSENGIELFKLAGLEWESRQPLDADELWYPAIRADKRFAWRLQDREDVIVQAAYFRGRPVYFKVGTAEGFAPSAPSKVFDDKRLYIKPDSIRVTEWILQLIMLAAAIPLALRNLRLDRSDRQTAFRLAVVLILLNLGAWFFEADHARSLYGEVTLLLSGLMWATFVAAVWWVGYLAVEPFVRRFWPNSLITWGRAFSGRYADARVGRDLLVGATLGTFFAPCWIMLNMLLHRQVTGEGGWEWLLQRSRSLLGPSKVVGEFLHCCNDAILVGILFLFLMFLLRAAFRSTLMSCLAFVVLWGGFNCFWVVPGMGGNKPIALAFGAITFAGLAAAWAFVLTRFGLLAFVATLYSTWLLDGFPITTDLTTWHGQNGLLAMAAVFLVGSYGFYTSSLAGRRLSDVAASAANG